MNKFSILSILSILLVFTSLSSAWTHEGVEHPLARGDVNGDDAREVTDAILILDFLFRDGRAPDCLAQADVNADGSTDVSDPVHLLLFLFAGGPEPGDLPEALADACLDLEELSFANIHEMVFARSCASSSCHSAQTQRAGLSLATIEDSYAYLVDAQPQNSAAYDAGLLRVDPGRPDNSFLLRKLTTPGPGEGNRMPANSPAPLSDATVNGIREWILAGAPLVGTIDGVPAITDEPLPPTERMPAPPVPENGVQIHMPPFAIAAGREREIFYYVDKPLQDMGRENVVVKRIDIHMMEQSHHFILYRWTNGTRPRDGFRNLGDGPHAQQWIVESQQSFRSITFPAGVGIRMNADDNFDINSHYINLDGGSTLMGEVYVNLFFEDEAAPIVEAKPITRFMVNINVPPNATRTVRGAWNPSRETHIYSLTSHTHRHGVEFGVVRTQGGVDVEDLYLASDWDDPETLFFDPPLVLMPGQGLRYWATHTYHDPPSPNAPALRWGDTSEDEMAILLGFYSTP